MAYYLTKDELYHHGILGMKWGIRRYQNEDGTYTSEGKKRRRLTAAEKNEEYARKAIEKYGGRNAAKNAVNQKYANAAGLAIATGMTGSIAGMSYLASLPVTALSAGTVAGSFLGPFVAGAAVASFIASKGNKKIAAIQDSNYGHDQIVGGEKDKMPQKQDLDDDRYMYYGSKIANKTIEKNGFKLDEDYSGDAYTKMHNSTKIVIDNPDSGLDSNQAKSRLATVKKIEDNFSEYNKIAKNAVLKNLADNMLEDKDDRNSFIKNAKLQEISVGDFGETEFWYYGKRGDDYDGLAGHAAIVTMDTDNKKPKYVEVMG